MGVGETFAKCILITFNIIFVLSGIGVLTAGIWLKADKTVVNVQNLVTFDQNDPLLQDAAWVLIGFGAFVLIVGVFGFIAGCTQNKCFIGLYITALVIIFAGEFAAGIMGAVFKSNVDDKLHGTLQKSVIKYNPNNTDYLATKGWNYIQTWLGCCGGENYTDYKNITFPDDQGTERKVPDTCCILLNKDPEEPVPKNRTGCLMEASTPTTKTFTFLQKQGCYDKLLEEIKSHLGLIIGVGVGIAMVQLIGIVLACVVCRRKND